VSKHIGDVSLIPLLIKTVHSVYVTEGALCYMSES